MGLKIEMVWNLDIEDGDGLNLKADKELIMNIYF